MIVENILEHITFIKISRLKRNLEYLVLKLKKNGIYNNCNKLWSTVQTIYVIYYSDFKQLSLEFKNK